ncbi:MAG: hypothetical protein ACKVOP_12795 [Sphingomonadaceae bacterium]
MMQFLSLALSLLVLGIGATLIASMIRARATDIVRALLGAPANKPFYARPMPRRIIRVRVRPVVMQPLRAAA